MNKTNKTLLLYSLLHLLKQPLALKYVKKKRVLYTYRNMLGLLIPIQFFWFTSRGCRHSGDSSIDCNHQKKKWLCNVNFVAGQGCGMGVENFQAGKTCKQFFSIFSYGDTDRIILGWQLSLHYIYGGTALLPSPHLYKVIGVLQYLVVK